MPEDNAVLAFDKLLYGKRAPAAAMSAFFLRNQVFLKAQEPTEDDLVDTFRGNFGFPSVDDDFVQLFDTRSSVVTDDERWFEPAPAGVLEVLIG